MSKTINQVRIDNTQRLRELIASGSIEQVQQFVMQSFHKIRHTESFRIMLTRLQKDEKRITALESELADARAELEREQRPWSVELCYANREYPFNRESLEIVDVGVSDRVLVVNSKVVDRLTALTEAADGLRDALGCLSLNDPHAGSICECCAVENCYDTETCKLEEALSAYEAVRKEG